MDPTVIERAADVIAPWVFDTYAREAVEALFDAGLLVTDFQYEMRQRIGDVIDRETGL